MNAQTQEALKTLLTGDVALRQRLAQAGSPHDAAVALAQAARQRGIEVGVDDLLARGQPPGDGEMSDEQLEMVAGGGWFDDFWNWLTTPMDYSQPFKPHAGRQI